MKGELFPPTTWVQDSTPMIHWSTDVEKITGSSDFQEEDVELMESGLRLPNVYVS